MGRNKVEGPRVARVEDLPATAFQPLTSTDLRRIRAFLVGDGGMRVARDVLARLVLDRERLVYVAAAAQEWRSLNDSAENMDRAADLDQDPAIAVHLAAESRRRAEWLLRNALAQLDGAGTESVQGGIRALVIRFSRREGGAHD